MEFRSKNNIIWDFDGVLVDSMAIREKGFREVLRHFPEEQVELLVEYHKKNGGLSRYVKFKYFFKEIRQEPISRDEVLIYADKFSQIMREHLVFKNILIKDSMKFVKTHYKNYNMHIVSGSDGEELRFLCKQLEISDYFKSIEGSPTPKIQLVKELLFKNHYSANQTLLIGDSINDYEAAEKNNIDFYGYNNEKLKGTGKSYLESFKHVLDEDR